MYASSLHSAIGMISLTMCRSVYLLLGPRKKEGLTVSDDPLVKNPPEMT